MRIRPRGKMVTVHLIWLWASVMGHIIEIVALDSLFISTLCIEHCLLTEWCLITIVRIG